MNRIVFFRAKYSFIMATALLLIISACSSVNLVRSDIDIAWPAVAEDNDVFIALLPEVHQNNIYFHILVHNGSDDSLEVTDEQFQFYQTDNRNSSLAEWEKVKVYRASEFFEKRRQEIIIAELSNSGSGDNANKNYLQSSYSTEGYRRNAYYTTSLGYYGSDDLIQRTSEALKREIKDREINMNVKETFVELDFLRGNLYFPSKVAPGADYYGIIVTDMGNINNSFYQLTIDTGYSKQNFYLQVQ